MWLLFEFYLSTDIDNIIGSIVPIFAFPGRVIKKTVTRPGDFMRHKITVTVYGGYCDFLLG